jgi:very-short-patch-repair endonuclease
MYYDFTLPSKNVIIEYHGEYYHDDVDYDKTIHMKFEDFDINYNRDLFKKWLAESKGFTVYILRSWEIKSDLLHLYNNLGFTEDLLWKLI